MSQNRQKTQRPASDRRLGCDALWRANVIGGVIGIVLAGHIGAPFLKQSTGTFTILILAGASMGWWIGTLTVVFSRRWLNVQRSIVTFGDWIIGTIGILGLAFALFQLYISFSRNQHATLFASSFLGTASFVALTISGFLYAGYALLGIGCFAISIFLAVIETKDLVTFSISLCWTALTGYALFLRLR